MVLRGDSRRRGRSLAWAQTLHTELEDELLLKRVVFMDDMEVVNERLLSHHVLGTVLP